jgi:hypothetical protein
MQCCSVGGWVCYNMVSKLLVQTLSLYGPRTSTNFDKFVVIVLSMTNLGENSERLNRNPQFVGKNRF